MAQLHPTVMYFVQHRSDALFSKFFYHCCTITRSSSGAKTGTKSDLSGKSVAYLRVELAHWKLRARQGVSGPIALERVCGA